MLKSKYSKYMLECGVDEAGRGCLAGPVTAAAVILNPDFNHELIDDSKKLSMTDREKLSKIIILHQNIYVCYTSHCCYTFSALLHTLFCLLHMLFFNIKI